MRLNIKKITLVLYHFINIIIIESRNFNLEGQPLTKKADRIEIERRRFPRLKVPVLFHSAKIEEEVSPTYNLGIGGVRIYSNRYLKKGKQLEIELCFPKGNSVAATVRVVWTKVLPSGSDAAFDIGLEFIDLPPAAIDEIKGVLETD